MFRHVIVTVLVIHLVSLCECVRKNVCKTIDDYQTIQHNPNCWYNPDVGATPGEIVRRYGYPFESYEVTTQDGYIVTLFRVPHNGTNIGGKKPVVFLQHGLSVDSSSYLLLGLKSSAFSLNFYALAFTVFVFANNGYDVWMSNSRGTKYSSKHTKYSVYDPAYWNFSFHEMALYDLPAMLEFIVQKTGQSGHINYIGHSMGTTISYIYSSVMPQHAKKTLRSITSLAPVAYMGHVTPLAKAIVPFRYLIWDFFSSIGLFGIGPNIQFKIDILRQVCSKYPFVIICGTLGDIAGTNQDEDLASILPVTSQNQLSGLSLKTLVHYAQIIDARRRFQYFDYGPYNNMKIYNSTIPPEYPVYRIKIPVYLFYGKRDLLATEKDVYYLYQKLKTKKTIMEVFNFGHNNFLSGLHAFDLYQMIVKYLQ